MSSSHEKVKKPLSADAQTPAGVSTVSTPPASPDTGEATPPGPCSSLTGSESPTITETSMSPEQLAALQAKAAKADEHWERLLRAKADLDNYRKRATRERQEAVRYANLSLLEKLIPTLDSFDKALAAADTASGNGLEALKTGIEMVHSHITKTLTEAGLQEIDATDQPFDPNVHEAVAQQESTDVPEGQVVLQLRKGYKLHDRLIRPAAVIVARKPTA